MAISPKEVDGTEAEETAPVPGTSVQPDVSTGVELWEAIPIPPQGDGDLCCSHIMHVGQSLTANKNELTVEIVAGAPEEDV